MESRIARLDEVEEPRKEWALQFSIGAAPRSSSVVATLNEAIAAAAATSRSARRRCRSTPATGSASPGPTAPARPRCCGCCSGGWRPDTGTASLGAIGRGRRDRPGPHRPGRGPAARRRRSRPPCRELAPGRRPHPAGEVRPQGRPGHQPGRPALARASAPAPRWRCCRPAGSTCWSSTSRPTTSTCPPSSSSSRRSTSYDGALLLVSHDRRLLDNVRLDQRWHVEDGQVTVGV